MERPTSTDIVVCHGTQRTDSFSGLIEEMFGGPRQSLSDVYEDVPDVGEDVLAYLKQEIDNSATTSNHSSASSKVFFRCHFAFVHHSVT